MIISLLTGLLVPVAAFPQNRICGWETEKITSVEIEITYPDDERETGIFNEQQDLDPIISFLKNVDFRSLDSSNLDSLRRNVGPEFKIVFQGQRDQVYLYRHSACIGKTSFLVDPSVIHDFGILIDKLAMNH